MSKVTRVVLSGGPCSGKTTCIEKIKSHYEDLGIAVFVCPESATEVIGAGVSRDDMLSFEAMVAQNQIKNELNIDSAVSYCDCEKILVIYDRGLTDCYGYVDDEAALSSIVGIGRIDSWSRYDSVMILQESFDYLQSDVRVEDETLAAEYASRVLNAWMGHPHLRYIKSCNSFDDKIANLIGEIDCLVSEKEMERKLLIEYPDMSALAKYNPFETYIEQAYLLSDVGSHRIRKRVANGVTSYYETLKLRISQMLCTEVENVITADDYASLMLQADPQKCVIRKHRYCFLYEGQYFELDVFPFWDDQAFLELELIDENQTILLPPEISVIRDVSEDSHYKNNYLAKKLYKEQMSNEDN